MNKLNEAVGQVNQVIREYVMGIIKKKKAREEICYVQLICGTFCHAFIFQNGRPVDVEKKYKTNIDEVLVG